MDIYNTTPPTPQTFRQARDQTKQNKSPQSNTKPKTGSISPS